MIRKTIIQYLVLTTLFQGATGGFAAVYATFLLSHGLNLFQVNLVNTVFFATMFICEIPTGAFADIFGRKMSFVMSCFIVSFGCFIYGMSTTIFGFMAAEMICGIGLTFSSGAFQSWLVDKLDHHGHIGSRHHIYSKEQIFGKAAGMIAAILGAKLASIQINLPWFFCGTLHCITGSLAFFWLKEEYFVRKQISFKLGLLAMKDTVKQSIEFGIKNKVVRFLLAASLIQVLAVQAPNMQWQPYFIQYLVEQQLLGYLWVGMMSGIIIGSMVASKLLRMVKNDEKRALVICLLGTGVGIAVTTLLPFPLGIVAYILHEVPRGMYKPLSDQYMHDNIPSHARATISSFQSISPNLGAMIGLLGSGALANSVGIQATWISSGLLLVVLTLIVSRNGSKKKLQG